MILFPNAKINIGLNVVNRRSDGYHNLETVFVPVDWKDILEIVPSRSDDTVLKVTGNYVDCPPEKNLVMKAYNALGAIVPLPPVEIYLHKIIPDGAGLGGGSSDAAFTLKALNEMFALGYSDDFLSEIAAGIGADCPFFIYNTPMMATGIGTELTPIELSVSDYDLALVKPAVGVSTKEAYAGVVPALWTSPLAEVITAGIDDWNSRVFNDFERSVFPSFPEIALIKERLIGMGAIYASMSGSGSAVYGFFNKGTLDRSQLIDAFPGCRTHLGHLLG